MYCVPACLGCKEAGNCPKGELPASAFTDSKPKPRRAYDPRKVKPTARVVQEDAPPHGVVVLSCGRTSTLNEQLFFSVWRPKRKNVFWCTKHDKWEPPKPAPKPEPLPDNPEMLF